MDTRRLPRTVVDPKVRRVGFFTSGEPPPARYQSFPAETGDFTSADGGMISSPTTPELSVGRISFSSVMIPPPRYASADGLPALGRAAATVANVSAHSSLSPLRRDAIQLRVGSFNPSEHMQSTSAMLSPSSSRFDDLGFTEELATAACYGKKCPGKEVASFPGSSDEMIAAVRGGANALAKSALTTASVVKTLPGVTAKDGVTFIESQNERAGTARSQKQKTTKAERRALQEAQRTAKSAAKAAAKDGGTFIESQNERAGTAISQKQKTTKAERRALQEAQRTAKSAAKAAGEGGKPPAASSSEAPTNAKLDKGAKPHSQNKDGPEDTATASEKRADRNLDKDRKKDFPHPSLQFDDKYRVEKAKRRAVVYQFEARNRVELFRHLPQYEYGSLLPYLESKFFHLDHIHPSIYQVGMQYISGSTSGGNARCKEMLLAFRMAIMDYSISPEKSVVRDLISKINSYVSFLIECRPLSVNMGNAIRFLKNRILKLHHNLSESEAKSILISDIDRFINEKIIVADKVIINHAVTKIRDGDVLLVYGHSTVVEMIIVHALELGKQFRIVIVDSRPKFEGRILLRKLVMKGISCTYTHINAISYVMHDVTRVFLGASSVLSNGTVYARVGTACVAMVAHAFQVPVLICCEAYKFHERFLLDSICSNELGDPDAIIKVHGGKDLNPLAKWADNENLRLLNLVYDATPCDYVSMIVTEHGMIPPTSVPVIIREYEGDQLVF